MGRIRVDEHTGRDAGIQKSPDDLTRTFEVARYVQPSFGRYFLAVLGDQADALRFQRKGQLDHLRGKGNLKVQPRLLALEVALNVLHLNVPAVLADMHGYAVGSRLLGQPGHGGGT